MGVEFWVRGNQTGEDPGAERQVRRTRRVRGFMGFVGFTLLYTQGPTPKVAERVTQYWKASARNLASKESGQ